MRVLISREIIRSRDAQCNTGNDLYRATLLSGRTPFARAALALGQTADSLQDFALYVQDLHPREIASSVTCKSSFYLRSQARMG